ncbi:MAG TPA: hypothetical protein VKT77_17810 [Chthonomonadaceae bacterium]|nr:hypothetical protein [Chthonomonadaceae bacterium]
MVEWQAIVLAVQILLLAAGWLLFQRARGELSAQAAETPILGEVRALQKGVKQLLQEIEAAADRQSARLESGCANAATLLDDIETVMREAEQRLEQIEERARQIGASTPVWASHAAAPVPISAPDRPHAASTADAGPAGAVAAQLQTTNVRTDASARSAADTVEAIRARIYALADAGGTAASIARSLQRSEGEVEILLSLRGQQ